jgi:hypothetical protein
MFPGLLVWEPWVMSTDSAICIQLALTASSAWSRPVAVLILPHGVMPRRGQSAREPLSLCRGTCTRSLRFNYRQCYE